MNFGIFKSDIEWSKYFLSRLTDDNQLDIANLQGGMLQSKNLAVFTSAGFHGQLSNNTSKRDYDVALHKYL